MLLAEEVQFLQRVMIGSSPIPVFKEMNSLLKNVLATWMNMVNRRTSDVSEMLVRFQRS